ncbi:MAG: hypothetical protein Q7T76_01430 [Ferruginibacter sp.]|nr:hypothetical protein [Ferruginibacter sp.]
MLQKENKVPLNNMILTIGVLVNIAFLKHTYLMQEGNYPLLINLSPLLLLVVGILYNRRT